MQKGTVQRCLIVCPPTVIKDVWLKEAYKLLKDFDRLHNSVLVKVASGKNLRERNKIVKKALESDHPRLVITSDSMLVARPKSKQTNKLFPSNETFWDYVVVDEAVKNKKTLRYKAIQRITHVQTHRLMLTATPMQNTLEVRVG